MTSLISTLFMFSVLFPTKLWFAPGQPMLIDVKATEPVTLRLADFDGHAVDARANATFNASTQVDLAKLYPGLKPGCYVLSAVPLKADKADLFAGTPLVVEVRTDKRPGGPPGAIVVRVEPMRYAVMETDAGPLTLAFYYDVAPNTVDNFLRLSEEGFYDGIAFHRIIPGFVLQAGDPLSLDETRAGTGGPGYTINAEFNRRPHVRGALSMARQGDEGEQRGNPPGPVAANSGSSQFFVCLNYDRTAALDGKYTVFGQVIGGDDVMNKLAAEKTGRGDRPLVPPVIRKVTVKPVTAAENPYTKLPRPGN